MTDLSLLYIRDKTASTKKHPRLPNERVPRTYRIHEPSITRNTILSRAIPHFVLSHDTAPPTKVWDSNIGWL